MQEVIRPEPEKIKAIINLESPKDKKQARQLKGMVQYYRDLWPKRSEILTPLTEFSKGGPTKTTTLNGIQLAPRHFDK